MDNDRKQKNYQLKNKVGCLHKALPYDSIVELDKKYG
jgi:hypothetical protein